MLSDHIYETQIGRVVATKLGPPDLPVVLFLPGLRHPATMWMPFADALANRYHCVLVDWPGQGRAEQPAKPTTTIDGMADALLTIVEQERWHGLHITGFSMGGMAAIPVASTLCGLGKCSTLTLIGTSATEESWLDRHVRFRLMLGCVRHIGWHALVGTAAKLFYSKEYLRSDRGQMYSKVTRMLVECGPVNDATLANAVVSRRTQPDDVLRSITCRTLVMRGQCDGVRTYDESLRLCRLIPHANERPMEAVGKGHGVCAEAPEFVLRGLEEHLLADSR